MLPDKAPSCTADLSAAAQVRARLMENIVFHHLMSSGGAYCDEITRGATDSDKPLLN